MKKNNNINNYKNLKVLVTGSTGFKGSWLCSWLYKLNAKVIGIGLRPEKDSILFKSLNLNKKISQHFVDITNFKKLNQIVKKTKPDIIFHLAAQSIVSLSYKDPLKTFNTNIIGSANILETVRINKIPNLVYITSDKCYLNLDDAKSYKENDTLGGLDNYSSSKASAELIFKSYLSSYFQNDSISIASARAGNVIGGGDFKKNRIVPDVIRSLKQNKKIILRNPNATRPWQHVLEPLYGYLLLGDFLINRKLNKNVIPNWNFGPHKINCKKVVSIVKLIIDKWAICSPKIQIQKNKEFHESKFLSLNIEKSKNELGWKPKLNLNETISLTVDWYKNFYKKNKLEKITNDQIDYYSKK